MQEKASCVEYILFIYIMFKFANLKVHYSNIARKPHDIFTFLGVERESTSMYVMHTNENVIKKVEM